MSSLKEQAHRAVKEALRKGLLVCPERCSSCGTKVGTLQAHHPDYEQPLAIEWLCAECHVRRHQELGDRPTRKKGIKKSRREAPFSIRVEDEMLAAYKAAAERAGMHTAEWARHVLDVASGGSRIRHVYYVDIEKMKPEEVEAAVKETARKVRTGKW